MLLVIDPGTRVTGYAHFRPPKLEGMKPQLTLSHYGRLTLPDTDDWMVRASIMTDGFAQLLQLYQPSAFVGEFPQHMGGVRGAAAEMLGYTLQLAFLLGSFDAVWRGYCRSVWVAGKKETAPAVYVYPSQWTGQLSKENRMTRLNEEYGFTFKKKEHDAADAVGLGIWYITKKLNVEFLGAIGAARNDLKIGVK